MFHVSHSKQIEFAIAGATVNLEQYSVKLTVTFSGSNLDDYDIQSTFLKLEDYLRGVDFPSVFAVKKSPALSKVSADAEIAFFETVPTLFYIPAYVFGVLKNKLFQREVVTFKLIIKSVVLEFDGDEYAYTAI